MTTLTFLQLLEIKESLAGVGRHQLPCGIELARNLRTVHAKIQEVNEVGRLVLEKYPMNGDGLPAFTKDTDEMSYRRELQQLNAQKYEVELITIPLSEEILKAFKLNKVEGTFLAPLFDVVFVDEVKKEA